MQAKERGFAEQVAAFLATAEGAVREIINLKTQVTSVGEGEWRVPVTVNSSEPQDSWICSPHTAYCRYSIEELDRLVTPFLGRPLKALCSKVGEYLWKAKIDDAVAINNWLISTNLYPGLNEAALRQWLTQTRETWPNHAIWFRSLNRRYAGEWLDALGRAGCILIPSRQVYLYDHIDPSASGPKNLLRDLKLLRKQSLTSSPACSWGASDFSRASELYRQLYLLKYSSLNPEYSAAFLKTWHQGGLLDLEGFRNDRGELEAVIGVFRMSQTITAPIVGYDINRPQSMGLYRLLMATVYDLASRTTCRINLSAGASMFKRLRGGVGTIEYSAVYVGHLEKSRQRAVATLGMLTRGIGEPMMKRFKL